MSGAPAIPVPLPLRSRRAARPKLGVVRRRPGHGISLTGGRYTYRVTDRLSKRAWTIMLSGFAARKRFRDIARELAAIGEPICERTIAKRSLEWRAEQARQTVLAEVNSEALASGLWRAEEIVSLVERVDIAAGWAARRRRRLWKTLRSFLRSPDRDGLRAVEIELFIYLLSAAVYERWGAAKPKGA